MLHSAAGGAKFDGPILAFGANFVSGQGQILSVFGEGDIPGASRSLDGRRFPGENRRGVFLSEKREIPSAEQKPARPAAWCS